MLVAGDRSFVDVLHESSADADLVTLGMARPGPEEAFTSYYRALRERTARLPTTLYVLAAQEIGFGELLR